MRQLLSPAQAAAYTGLSVRTLSRLVAAGQLPVHRTPGGHRRFATTDLDTLTTQEDLP